MSAYSDGNKSHKLISCNPLYYGTEIVLQSLRINAADYSTCLILHFFTYEENDMFFEYQAQFSGREIKPNYLI